MISVMLGNMYGEELTGRVLGQYFKDLPKDGELVDAKNESQDAEAHRDRDQDAVLEWHVEAHDEWNRINSEKYIQEGRVGRSKIAQI